MAIIISHPHYYTTYFEWSTAFSCPVHISADDAQWLCRRSPSPPSGSVIESFEGPPETTKEIVPGLTAIKAGGHFPGSLLLHWEKQLWIADTIVTVPVRNALRLYDPLIPPPPFPLFLLPTFAPFSLIRLP